MHDCLQDKKNSLLFHNIPCLGIYSSQLYRIYTTPKIEYHQNFKIVQVDPWQTKFQINVTDTRNDPKFLDRYVWANSADPDQTALSGAVWSGTTLFAIPTVSFGLITLW